MDEEGFQSKWRTLLKYMLCFFDEYLHIGFNPKEDRDALNMIYRLKEGFGPPDRYLGANVEKVQLKDG